MGSHDCEEELKKECELVARLAKQIERGNQKMLEMEDKYNNTVSTTKKLVIGLVEKINSKDRSLFELEQKYEETSTTMRWLMHENAKLLQEHRDEITTMDLINLKLKCDMELQSVEFQNQAQELEQRKAQNALERSSLTEEIQKLKEKSQDEIPTVSENKYRAQIDALRTELTEKAEAMQYLEMLNQMLITKEFTSNQELQEARNGRCID
ncbi:uncharacterized protein LOC119989729 isoform X2 [Tripterygium wilfordii]|uniref:uncharacterized protein LOC119989729 isoform X2 n=1 Tax=Tripterygium wilfordii TaxID=458696 RepID=UPI0018F82F24|nr:uncharacterized protein LOC119989729 isoform X2 [Tripterygium wilfordii]